MSEEEIIEIIKDFLELREIHSSNSITKSYLSVYKEAIQSLLDLYNKEKEKNKELEEYANWHIQHTTEDIQDYIDDGRKSNENIIGELKEEREHWKDIIRLMKNEKTYIDYENY